MPISDKRPPVVIEMHFEAFGDSRDGTTEIDRDEWDAKTPAEREKLAQQIADEFAAEHAAWGWNIADLNDYAAAVGEQASGVNRPNMSEGGADRG